jgi:hypothetical protein
MNDAQGRYIRGNQTCEEVSSEVTCHKVISQKRPASRKEDLFQQNKKQGRSPPAAYSAVVVLFLTPDPTLI